jgi:hypothetical protein
MLMLLFNSINSAQRMHKTKLKDSNMWVQFIYSKLAKTPGVARDSLRNKITPGINYGII